MTDNNDEGYFNAHFRIGPTNGDETVALHTQKTVQKAGGNNGAYKFTLDKATHVVIRYNASNNQMVIHYPHFYPRCCHWRIMGTNNQLAMTTSDGITFTKAGVEISNGSTFEICQNYDSGGDWGKISASRLGYSGGKTIQASDLGTASRWHTMAAHRTTV